MIETLLNGGPFMLVLLVLFGSVIFISLKNIKEPYNTNSIVLLGIFSAVFGIFATYLGINSASNAVANISNISPQILISGLKTSLITSFTGGIIMLISTALWYFFIKRHNLLVV
jgi:LytS/YehU family sensor histidine kinase